MRYLASSISVLSALAIVGPAVAAELPPTPKRERPAPQRAERPAPQQTAQQGSNWNGGQMGGSNGASGVNNNFVEPGAYLFSGCAPPGSSSSFGSPVCAETPFSFSSNTNWRYTAGGFFGWRQQVGFGKGVFPGGLVVGFEGDVYYQNAETSFAQSGRPSWFSTTGFETFTGSVKQGTNGSFRGRIGALVTPWTLVYATGGLAVGEISGSFSYLACTTSPCSSGTSVFGATSWNETRVGGTAGAGVETELFPGWKGRLEYRYTDFGSITKDVALSNNVSGSCSPTVCGNVAHIETKTSSHRILVGLGFDLGQILPY
jgi:outer membrane immunogenic protein